MPDDKARGARSIATRLAVWLSLAFAATLACLALGLRIPEKYVIEIFTGKLALLGLTPAIATFQWSTWSSAARELLEQIRDPEWGAIERRLEAETADPGGKQIGRRTQITRWHKWRLTATGIMLNGLLPFNRTILTNLLVVSYLLAVSCVSDMAGILLAPTGGAWQAISLGSLIATVPPFAEGWVRYARSLSSEFEAYEAAFEEARSESKRKSGEENRQK